MWTSHTSAKYTDLTFDGDDSQFADFTIRDFSGRFTAWLVERGCEQAESWSRTKIADGITYSIEVKSTYGPHDEAFHMSQNQIDMVCQENRSLNERVLIFAGKAIPCALGPDPEERLHGDACFQPGWRR